MLYISSSCFHEILIDTFISVSGLINKQKSMLAFHWEETA